MCIVGWSVVSSWSTMCLCNATPLGNSPTLGQTLYCRNQSMLGCIYAADSISLSSLIPTHLAPETWSLCPVKCKLGIMAIQGHLRSSMPVSYSNWGPVSHCFRVVTAYWLKFLLLTGGYPILNLWPWILAARIWSVTLPYAYGEARVFVSYTELSN